MAKKHKPELEADVDPKAPVIDLKAEEVEDMDEPAAAASESASGSEAGQEAAAGPASPPPAAAPAAARSPARLWGAVALVALAAIGGAWAYKSYGARFWPSDEMTAMAARLATLEAENKTLSEQLRGIGTAVDALKASSGGIDETIKAAQAAADTALQNAAVAQEAARGQAEALATLEARTAATQQAIDALKAVLAAQPAAENGQARVVDTAALGELRARVETIEKDVADLKARGGTGGAEVATLLSQALADLKAKIAAGTPFADEMQRIANLVPAAPGLEVLERLAAHGVPSPAMLAEEAARLAETLTPPAPPPAAEADGSYWSTVLGVLGSVVKIRNIGETDWSDVALKASAAAADGNLREALALAAGEGPMPDGLRVWRERVQARIDADSATEALSAAVLRQIAAIGGAP
jgi:hypothetical protein